MWRRAPRLSASTRATPGGWRPRSGGRAPRPRSAACRPRPGLRRWRRRPPLCRRARWPAGSPPPGASSGAVRRRRPRRRARGRPRPRRRACRSISRAGDSSRVGTSVPSAARTGPRPRRARILSTFQATYVLRRLHEGSGLISVRNRTVIQNCMYRNQSRPLYFGRQGRNRRDAPVVQPIDTRPREPDIRVDSETPSAPRTGSKVLFLNLTPGTAHVDGAARRIAARAV